MDDRVRNPAANAVHSRQPGSVTVSVIWFRRDLRLADHPALLAALAVANEVVPLFVLDPVLLRPAGAPRVAQLLGCLEALGQGTDGALVVRGGDPAEVVAAVAAEVGAAEVFVTEDFGPYGRSRDERVAERLAADGRALVAEGTPYAVSPGTLSTTSGTSYKVFTPFSKAWHAAPTPAPSDAPRSPRWRTGVAGEALPDRPDLDGTAIVDSGEAGAAARLERFLDGPVRRYAEDRNRPDLEGTSRLSVDLKYGTIHPRQVLARLGRGKGARVFADELAWREFYAEVLLDRPETARQALKREMADIEVDDGASTDERFAAWAEGRTGFPVVDAGMRQLLGEAWMHNRLRMITASFLVKDLHLDWTRGARHFMTHLQDGDLASNNHGWQWVAGTGTDAAPYFRVFNPVTQGRRFDPSGDYVRRWVPELAHVQGPAVHEPWTIVDEDQGALFGADPSRGYPLRMVDHAEERDEALARYEATRS